MANAIFVDSPQKMNKVIRTILNRIVYAVGNAIPPAAQEVAKLVHTFQINELKASIGTKNKTGRPNKKTHMSITDGLFLIQRHRGQVKTHYDIVTRVPHAMWVEMGSRAPSGLPWSGVSGERTRDYSKSSFDGYHALERGLKRAQEGEAYKLIVARNIREKVMKMRP